MILIDCGASVDIAEHLSLHPGLSVYLFESHRPYRLENLFERSNLYIFDDGSIEEHLDYLQEAFQGQDVNCSFYRF